MLQQSQLREDIADKDEQITHLREAQDIQMKSITSSVATDILDLSLLLLAIIYQFL